MKRKWIYRKTDITNLKRDERLTGISPQVLTILKTRGYDTCEKIEEFLFSNINNLRDTRLMQDAEKAVDIISESIKNGEKMVVYGDYDADGVSSVVVMVSLLKNLGADVEYHTNNRFVDGYGMCVNGVDVLLSKYPDLKLIITCDNGIMAFDGVDYAKSKGLKVVVTDHHEQGEYLPNADAVVDPKRKDDNYPFKGLCGAGVVFKLMLLLYWKMGKDLADVYAFLDIVAMATVGDVVPIVDENRIIVKEGLTLINEGKRAAFRILAEITSTTKVNSHFTLAFMYVPMINAIGRLDGEPSDAIEMFMSEDEDLVRSKALKLQQINDERKKMTETQSEIANKILKEKGEKNVIILYDESFHEGLVGLIAGRIKESTNKPVVVLTKQKELEDGDILIKGSARSIDGFHLKESFDKIASVLNGYGGHEKAAGLSLRLSNLEKFEECMLKLAEDTLTDDDYIKKYNIDLSLSVKNMDIGIIDELSTLEPFGEGFPKPVVVLDGFKGKEIRYMGDEKQHVKVSADNISMIMWRQGETFKRKGSPLNIKAIGYPELNVFRNNVSIQFVVDGDNFLKGQPPPLNPKGV